VKQIIKIGTRKSQLAMIQTELVVKAIKAVNKDVQIELVPMTTIGDKVLDKPLESFGGKGAFITEFEDALLAGKIDLAVHSAKDMPIELKEGLGILAVSKREDPRDVLVTRKDSPLMPGGIAGTSSLRRQVQLEELYQVQTRNLRGNVGTRLNKLREKEYDAIILAAAGLKRLNMLEDEEFHYEYLSEDTFIPAAGQGIIAVEGRKKDGFLKELFDSGNSWKEQDVKSDFNSCNNLNSYSDLNFQSDLNSWSDMYSMYSLETEREVLKLLGAGCSEPIGVYSNIQKGQMTLRILYKYNGKVIRMNGTTAVEDRLNLAQELVDKMKLGT
jgi:hydroxymethylbilane synthase/uroporphyrinogen III methyltransferase/synthase